MNDQDCAGMEPLDRVVSEFEFKEEGKTFFLALVAGLAARADQDTLEALYVRAREYIPDRVLTAAIKRLDELELLKEKA